MKILSSILAAITFLLATEAVLATDTLVFDSTDNYLGGCQFTNKSSWELSKNVSVSNFQIWYKWDTGETSLPVTVFKNGEKFASFEAKRGGCDPYQTTWCNADYPINTLFPTGSYTTEIPNSRQCLKPGGTGTVRLYATDAASLKATPIPTVAPTVTPTQGVLTVQPKEIPTVMNSCSCNQTVTIATAAGVSSLLSIGISLLLRRK